MPAIGAAIAAIAASITATVSAALIAVGGWSGIVAFLTSPFGALILGIGLQLITNYFAKKPAAPSIEAAKVNVRIPEPERWLSAGRNRQGGGVIFAEFDADGNFWYVIVHCDSILTSTDDLFFDDTLLTIDGSGNVMNNEFSLNSDGDAYDGSGTQVTYFNIQTTTHTEADPTPPAIAALAAAFAGVWTSDHKLVGTTYSVVKIKPVSSENRYKIFRWRGPVGIGEPSFSIVGNWSNVYDPRDVGQTEGDPTSYLFSKNAVLLWAWYRTHRYGRNKAIDSVNWTKVAEQASICDQIVTDIDLNTAPRYECGIAIPESTERTNGEQQILMSCDAQLVFDDDGKCWPRVGYFYTPSVKLVRNRDIVAMESVEAQNGESLTQGVIVRYIDPDVNFTTQPCAPWVNPTYFVEGETPKFLVVDALSIQNHNQAMRLAKSIGHRSQPPHKLLPTVGLRGLRARQHRIVSLLYDNDFSGDYEIVTPVEVDEIGAFCGFGVVPVDVDRWTLLAGEEKSKPASVDSSLYYIPVLPTGVVVQFINSRIEVSYDAPPRDDWFYEVQYQEKTGPTPDDALWISMTVQTNDNYAYSGSTVANTDYFVRWRAASTGGNVSAWVTPVSIVNTSSLTLTGTPILTGSVGVAYAGFTIGVTGGQSPYTFTDTYGRLPPGIVVDAATGAVSGTPTSAGTYSAISIKVLDNVGNFKTFPEFEIVVT